ncbi:hypothetical protein HZB69_02835 [Candidatus Amesbacteria bacterium]|nr:hypothetical protein [Candidatus Amesbacteria bacterium]
MKHLILDIKSEKGFVLDEVWEYLLLPDSEGVVKKINSDWKGYLVNYDQITFDDLVKACKHFDTNTLQGLNSDYLLMGLNNSKSELNIISGVSGKFPLYFSPYKDGFVASTDISEIIRRKTNKKININSALDYLYTDYFMYTTHETFIEGVYKLPVGHRLRIDRNYKFKIEPIFNLDKFLRNQQEPFSVEKFQEKFLDRMVNVVRERTIRFPNTPIGCELSSGFDSSLIAYALKKAGISQNCTFFSDYSKYDTGDTDKSIVEKFAIKHNLKLSFLDISDLTTFSDIDTGWSKKYFFPGTHALLGEIITAENRRKIYSQPNLLFRGFGADELFMSYLIHHNVDKMIKDELEWAKFGIEQGIGKIFTNKGLEILKSRDRMFQTPVYFSIFSPSSVEWAIFSIYWEYGEWSVLPFNDLELLEIARRIPRKNGKPLKKQEIWAGRTDIFLPEQYKQKLPFDNHVLQIFEKRKGFLVKILSNSVLGKAGLINSSEMREAVATDKAKDLYKNMLPVFINVIWLENYLQANDIIKL